MSCFATPKRRTSPLDFSNIPSIKDEKKFTKSAQTVIDYYRKKLFAVVQELKKSNEKILQLQKQIKLQHTRILIIKHSIDESTSIQQRYFTSFLGIRT